MVGAYIWRAEEKSRVTHVSRDTDDDDDDDLISPQILMITGRIDFKAKIKLVWLNRYGLSRWTLIKTQLYNISCSSLRLYSLFRTYWFLWGTLMFLYATKLERQVQTRTNNSWRFSKNQSRRTDRTKEIWNCVSCWIYNN